MDELSIGQCATLATLMEVVAPKPGNVHRGADFEDVTFADFVVAAIAIGPAMESAVDVPLGRTVLSAVQATRQAVGTNTNFGTILLLAPLAKVPREVPLAEGVPQVLSKLSPDDAREVYQAIRLARPGGLGRVETADVREEPPADLLWAMRLAAPRDMVARQYAENFHHVLQLVVPWLAESHRLGRPISTTVVHVYLRLLSEFPDSLIARKCSEPFAREVSVRAAAALAAGEPDDEAYEQAVADLDFYLRAAGHRRNPGTTADLVAAGLFAALRDGIIQAPFRLA